MQWDCKGGRGGASEEREERRRRKNVSASNTKISPESQWQKAAKTLSQKELLHQPKMADKVQELSRTQRHKVGGATQELSEEMVTNESL